MFNETKKCHFETNLLKSKKLLLSKMKRINFGQNRQQL